MEQTGRGYDGRGVRFLQVIRLFPWSRNWYRLLLTGVITVALGFPLATRAQEIAPFRLTGMDGFLSFRTFLDRDGREQRGGGGSSSEQRTFEEELNVLFHSYIYHPNFLKLDFGGGVVLSHDRFATDNRRDSTDTVAPNVTGRLSILERKPFPLVLFFNRTNSPTSVGFAERFLVTDTRYGLHFSLLEPFAPLPFSINAFRQTQKGEGPTQVTDEEINQVILETHKSFPDQGMDASLVYQFNQQDSASGNPQFTIEPTQKTRHSVDSTFTYVLGSRQQARLQDLFSFFTQLDFPTRTDVRNNLTFRWRVTDSFSWLSNYNLRSTRTEGLTTKSQAASVGFSHRLYQSLFTDIDLHTDESRTLGLSSDQTYGLRGSVLYRKRLPFGGLALHYGALYDISDRRSTEGAQIPVFGERHVLSGLLPVELDNENVVLSSVEVFNETRSQMFQEGRDYQLSVVGNRTRIQRLLGGDIEDGETVLVDYLFTTSGTFKFSSFDQNYGVRLNILTYLSLFARFRNNARRLLEGTPLQPLNSIQSHLYGVQLHIPLGGFVLGGSGEFEEQEEDIAPFRRTSYAAFLQAPLASSLLFFTGFNRTLVDNFDSPEDVDALAFHFRLEFFPRRRMRLSAEFRSDQDRGGTLERKTQFFRLLGEWRIRRLILRAEGEFDHEEQGDFERDKTRIKMEIRREF